MDDPRGVHRVKPRGQTPENLEHRLGFDGAWIVGLYNPRGAWRGDVWKTGSVTNSAFTIKEILKPRFNFRSARLLYQWPELNELKHCGDELHITVGPGGLVILEIFRCTAPSVS